MYLSVQLSVILDVFMYTCIEVTTCNSTKKIIAQLLQS